MDDITCDHDCEGPSEEREGGVDEEEQQDAGSGGTGGGGGGGGAGGAAPAGRIATPGAFGGGPPAGNPRPGLAHDTLHRAPVGQGLLLPWPARALGFWYLRALANGTAWAGLCLQGDVAFDDDISVSLLEVDFGGSTSARAA